MSKILTLGICALTALFVLALGAQRAEADGKAENTEKAVTYLIEEVASSNLTFIRNGERYSSQEAAEHLRTKYDYFRSKIKTPEDFIRLCASKSLFSGEQYLVATPQGNIPVETWLGQILERYRRIPPHSLTP